MVREVGDGDVFPQGKVAAGTSGCLQKCIRWMSKIKGFQEEGAPWFGAINGDCVGFSFQPWLWGPVDAGATGEDEIRRWRVV